MPIHDALGEGPFKTELIAAGASRSLLALLADALLVGRQRLSTPWARAARRTLNVFVEAFEFIGRNGGIPGEPQLPTLVHLTLETLKVSAIGVLISAVIALPLGVWLGHIHRGSFVAINIGNLGRALPSLAILAIGVAFLGLGLGVVELALVILAVPPMITNAYLAVDGVDREIVDAARGMGMSEWEILWRIELPLSTGAHLRRDPHRFAVRGQHDDDRGPGRLQREPRRCDRRRVQLPLLGVLGAAICVAALALASTSAWRECRGS